MRLGIFGRMLIAYALVFIVGAGLVEYYIGKTIKANHIRKLDEALIRQAYLISERITFKEPQGSLDGFSKDIKNKIRARVTIIAPDGRVIGDSDKESLYMDNHIERPEIQKALIAGRGMSIRKSDTLKEDLLYTALRISEGEKTIGYVRLSVPLGDIISEVNNMKAKILIVVGIVLLAVGILSVGQIVRLRALTHQISEFTNNLVSGEFKKRLFFEESGEFNEIASNLNLMASELTLLMDKSTEEKNRLSAILKGIPDALLVVDSRGLISLASNSAQELFGQRGDIIGKPVLEVVGNLDVFSLIKELEKTGSSIEREATIGERNFIVTLSPINGKEQMGFIAIFHDITQAKKLEKTRKDFVANVSHEIKTPLTAIKGFSDTLLAGAIDDRETALKFIRTIKSNSERLNNLVDDLMTISKLELGVIKIEKTEVEPSDVIESVCMTLGESATKKGLYLKRSIEPSIGKVFADRERLIQVLTNLLDNAIKFTETGGVTIGIDREEDSVFFFVKDTGIGIPKRHLPRIGERFYRVEPSRSKKLGGTGLGLAIVKHIVIAHGWHMKIESQEGKGTIVKILVS